MSRITKTGPKFDSELKRERHLAEVAHLHLQGKYQSAIALACGVTQQQISYDLRVLGERWRQLAIRDVSAALQEEISHIMFIRREAWAGWEASKLDKEVVITEVIGDVESASGEQAGKKGRRSKVRRQRVGQTGNPIYLQAVQWTVEQLAKIYGLYAPIRSEVDVAEQRVQEGIERLGEVLQVASAEERAAMLKQYEQYMESASAFRTMLSTVPETQSLTEADGESAAA